MPEFFSVLCRSGQPVRLEEVRTFVREGCFFEEPVRLVPVIEGAPPPPAGWTHLELHYQEGKRPVILSHVHPLDTLEAHKEESLEELRQLPPRSQPPGLGRHLESCQQAFVLEVDPVGASEECWMMVDALEAWLARTREGVVFVPGEGFHDAALQPLCALSSGEVLK